MKISPHVKTTSKNSITPKIPFLIRKTHLLAASFASYFQVLCSTTTNHHTQNGGAQVKLYGVIYVTGKALCVSETNNNIRNQKTAKRELTMFWTTIFAVCIATGKMAFFFFFLLTGRTLFCKCVVKTYLTNVPLIIFLKLIPYLSLLHFLWYH